MWAFEFIKEAGIEPKFSKEEQKGLQDYWKVYEDHRADVAAELLRMASNHSEFNVILQNSQSQPTPEQQQASLQIQERAIYHGEWKPYVENLKAQGMQYARTGLSFHAWFEIVAAFRKYMTPHLLEAYGSTPKRLSAALQG